MINANELMVGNWVELADGRLTKIKNIQERSINMLIDGDGLSGSYPLSSINPVSLTKEVFKKTKPSKYFHLSNDNCPYECEYYYKPAEELNWVPVPNLNQFQNIYFLLTSEQLVVDLS